VVVRSWFWKGSYFPYQWGSGNYHAAAWNFWVHMSVSGASAAYQGWWTYIWTYALNWYKIKLFSEYLSGFAWFTNLARLWSSIALERHISNKYGYLTINLYFGHPCHFTKSGHGALPHSVYQYYHKAVTVYHHHSYHCCQDKINNHLQLKILFFLYDHKFWHMACLYKVMLEVLHTNVRCALDNTVCYLLHNWRKIFSQ
jgi:hypothetical protein